MAGSDLTSLSRAQLEAEVLHLRELSTDAAAQRRLRQAQEAGGIGLFTVDVVDDLLIPTPEFCRLFGLPVRSHYPASVIEQRVLPEDRHIISNAPSRVSGAVPKDVEYRVTRADTGALRWIARKGEVEFDDQGRAVRFVGVARDVTDQRVARDALVRSEERYRALFDAIDDGFCIIEFFDGPHGPLSDYRHVEANSGYERHTGIAGIVGKTLRDVAPNDADGWLDLYGGVLRTGQGVRFQRHFPEVGRYIEVSAARVEPASRQQVSVLFRDIDARKRAEDALNTLNETLEQRVADRTAELMLAEEQLRQAQKMEAVGQLTGGLAHDFNNLLTVMSGAMEMIHKRMEQGRTGDIGKYLVSAQSAARRAAALTHRLLAFSRRQTLDPRPTDVNALVHGMVDLVQRTVGPEIAVDTSGPADLWPALVDQSQLENALLNLCLNARDAMPNGGRIAIETANVQLDSEMARDLDLEEGCYLSLCVTDTGHGMTQEVIAKAFDPFFTTKPLGQGTGLGLSMIYGFAQQSGGGAYIRSLPQEGASLCIYLPRHANHATPEAETSQEPSPFTHHAGKTVLVVDDEPHIRMLVADALQDMGHTAIEAADGPSALAMLQSSVAIDLVISDIGLPGGMNGRQMIEAARHVRPDLVVMFITGYAENTVLGDGSPADDMQVLTKPFTVENLARRIQGLMGR